MSTGLYSGFVVIDIISGDLQYKTTTLPYDVTIGGELYTADRRLKGIDPPRTSSNVDRAAYRIGFLDPDGYFLSNMSMLFSATVSVRGGFFNTLDADVVALDNVTYTRHEAILSEKDMITLYRGYVDIPRYVSAGMDCPAVTLECASPMSMLDATNAFYTTPDSLKQRTATEDTSFDQVSLGGKSIELEWGKK